MKRHPVRPGECVSSIAFEHGFAPQTIWEHPENAPLRRVRPNMFQLVAGEDVVFIPDLRPRQVPAATSRSHRFRRRGVPEKLCLQFLDEAAVPRAGLPYRVEVDGIVREGVTDAGGKLECFIRPNAIQAVVVLTAPAGFERYDLALGHLPPAALDDASRGTLRALGFLGAVTDPEHVIAAVRAYQASRGVTITGDLDVETRIALRAEPVPHAEDDLGDAR